MQQQITESGSIFGILETILSNSFYYFTLYIEGKGILKEKLTGTPRWIALCKVPAPTYISENPRKQGESCIGEREENSEVGCHMEYLEKLREDPFSA